MKISFLNENRTDRPGVTGEYGLAIYIETTDGKKILFDAGPSPGFIKNAAAMGVDLSAVDAVVISHGHFDHTGGVPAFCEINKTAPVYIHKNALRTNYVKNPLMGYVSVGIQWTEEQRKGIKDRLVLTGGPLQIYDNMWITGTLPDIEASRPSQVFYTDASSAEDKVKDDMSHEQCLVIDEPDGIVIFAGCCHRGVVASLKAGMSLFPGRPVKCFVAGMHLANEPKPTRDAAIEALAKAEAGLVIPMHCTGMDAMMECKATFGDRCKIGTSGAVFAV